MRLRPEQLPVHLKKGLAPVYLVSGDEPLQVGETADAIRAAAREAGFRNREILEVDGRFDWNLLQSQADERSLFAEKKVVDLRIPGGKPGREGGAALLAWCENLPADILLLVTLPRLERGQQNSKWAKALEKSGVLIQVWPPDARQFPRWVEQRMRAAGLQPEPGVAAMLAEQTEGNLLAARQEIEKLVLLHGEGRISQEQLSRAVSDSARFDVFGLVDAALAGEDGRVIRVISGLRAEGVALPVVLWALAREIRGLALMAARLEQGIPLSRVLADARVWKSRQPLVGRALRRLAMTRWRELLQQCQLADAMIKGARPGDPWLQLEQIALAMAGARSVQGFWPLVAAGG